jgi:hypothetical protein
MKNKVLFVTEKFCDGTPDLGLTNNFHNLFNSFSIDFGSQYNWNTIHLDEAHVVYGNHVDNFLVDYCKRWGVNIIIYSLLGGSPLNPSLETLEKIKDLGIYQCAMWPDTGPDWGFKTIEAIGDRVSTHVSWDNPTFMSEVDCFYRHNHIDLWVPQDVSLFHPQDNQDLDVSFIGSPRYYDRHTILQKLISSGVNLSVRGGQREEMLSAEDYASLIRRSKINLNFSLSPANFYQTKGRVFETLACRTLLLELKNPSTSRLFTPGRDYVEFSTINELIGAIKYYSVNDEERNKIARQGYDTYKEKYSSKRFWEIILNGAKEFLK